MIVSTHVRCATRRLRSACATVLAGTFACVALMQPAHADIGVTGTSTPTTYTRGGINSYLLDQRLVSEAYSGADALIFSLPERVTLSAVRKRNTFSFCSDVYPLVNGMGTSEGGWYQLGYPELDGCGSLSGAPAPGYEQIVIVDIEVPADYVGDLPLAVHVLGDGYGDPPNEASLMLTMTDDGAPLAWHLDDLSAPALPGDWTTTVNDGVAWTTQSAIADSVPNALHAPTPATSGEAALTSASVTVPASGGELHFRHRFATEAAHDGGVLELAIDGGAFTDLLSAGGQFTTGGYTGSLATGCTGNANPLAGRVAWSGTQDAFATVAAQLPASASGHGVQFRWRLGTDCAGATDAPNGWWIDDVRLVSTQPSASLPAKLAVTLNADAQRIERLAIGNDGGGTLNYTITMAAAGDGSTPPACDTPVTQPWLSIAAASGGVAGDTRDNVALAFDASAVGPGGYAATLCVASNDATQPLRAIPLAFSVSATACTTADRVFANGFDDNADGSCGSALRTFSDRDAFLASVAPGHEESTFTALRTGYVHGPLRFGSAHPYSVTATPPTDYGDFYLFDGAGVLSTVSPGDTSIITITFTGAAVTALGGNVWGQMFQDATSAVMNLQPATMMRIELDDGTVETFTATSQQDFRGFISTQPIHSLSFSAPEAGADGGFAWGVLDNLVVGTAR